MVKKVLAKAYLYILLAVLYAPIILIIIFVFYILKTNRNLSNGIVWIHNANIELFEFF